MRLSVLATAVVGFGVAAVAAATAIAATSTSAAALAFAGVAADEVDQNCDDCCGDHTKDYDTCEIHKPNI